VVSYDVQSLEPTQSRTLKFILGGKNQISQFQRFLYERDGKLVPFWIQSDDDSIEIVGTAVAGQNKLIVAQMDYERSLSGSPSKMNLEIELVTGEVFRTKVLSVMQTLDRNEELTLVAPLPYTVSESLVFRNNWMQLVRFDTDEIKLEWETDESVTSSVPIVTLP